MTASKPLNVSSTPPTPYLSTVDGPFIVHTILGYNQIKKAPFAETSTHLLLQWVNDTCQVDNNYYTVVKTKNNLDLTPA